MLGKLKSCFKVWTFCRDALAEDLKQRRWYAIMSTTFAFAQKHNWVKRLIGWVLAASIPAYYVGYQYRAFLLSHKRWVAIIALSIVVAFLLRLIVAIKRFHERTVNQRVFIAKTLSRCVGMMDEHLASLSPETKSDKEFCQNWLNGVEDEAIRMCFGPDDRPEALRKLHNCTKPLSDHIGPQVLWARRYMANSTQLFLSARAVSCSNDVFFVWRNAIAKTNQHFAVAVSRCLVRLS
jgi:hypothetical protein